MRNFIKFAPPNLKVRLVGVESNSGGNVGQWQVREIEGRQIDFFPLFKLNDDNERKRIPTTLRYIFGLLGKDFSSDFMHFHRLETAVAARQWLGHKTLFVHNDINQQIQSKDAKSIFWQRFPWVYFSIERQLIGQFDQVLSCNSESMRLYQERYRFQVDQISFIRNSFDGCIFYPLSPASRQELRIKQARVLELPIDTKFLLFAGRLHPQKDPLLLLKALALVQSPHTHLLVAGEGELSKDMAEAADKLGLNDRVTFLGALPYQEVANLYRIASLFVLTSAYEGLPLVVLEALACGTPVVTTRAGETPRLLRPDCGLVCEERSPKAVAKAIDTVLQNPERFPPQACVENARPYSAKSVIESAYAEMLQQQSHPQAISLV